MTLKEADTLLEDFLNEFGVLVLLILREVIVVQAELSCLGKHRPDVICFLLRQEFRDIISLILNHDIYNLANPLKYILVEVVFQEVLHTALEVVKQSHRFFIR